METISFSGLIPVTTDTKCVPNAFSLTVTLSWTDTDLVAFKIGASTHGETLLAAEALEFRAHDQRVAFKPLLLTPHAHNLNILLLVD